MAKHISARIQRAILKQDLTLHTNETVRKGTEGNVIKGLGTSYIFTSLGTGHEFLVWQKEIEIKQ